MIMKRWMVSYSENRLMELIVEAESEEEAERMVLNGDADYDKAYEQDAEIVSVNDVYYLDCGDE